MKVAVTGGAGFIGANTVRRLLADGAEVTVLDDLSTGDTANLDGLDVELLHGSVLDRALLASATRGAGAVIHLAAMVSVPQSVDDPIGSHEVNATGTLNVLEAARRSGGSHVVLASSAAVYGTNPELPKHEGLRPSPVSPYAAGKIAGETLAEAYAHSYGLDVLPFRFFNVFGPLQPAGHAYAAVVPAFLDAALAGRPITLFGDGSQTRDFVFVDSVARLLSQAVHERVSSPEPVNLAFGGRTSLLELLAVIEGLLGRPLEVERLPVRSGDVPHSQADGARLRALFPDHVPLPLHEGVRRTLEWFQNRQPVVRP